MDFQIVVKSIPQWISAYSTAQSGCAHRIFITLSTKISQPNHEEFTSHLCSTLSIIQRRSLG